MGWLARLLRRTKLERDLDKELRYDIERRIADLVAQGVKPQEAARRVRLEFGGADEIKEACRDARGTRWLEDFFRDCRHGLRLLRRTPMFTGVAILSLSLGIGANTAIFSLIDRVMFRALPVHDADQLFEIGPCCLSHPLFEELRTGNLSNFDGIFGRSGRSLGPVDIWIDSQSETATFDEVSGAYFRVLGISAAPGRTFTEDVDRSRGTSPVAVIGHSYWERRFASDSAVIGKTFRRLNTTFTIIGVTPRGFFGTVIGQEPDITVPLNMDAEVRGSGSCLGELDCWWVATMGRLKAGRTVEQARAELATLQGPGVTAWRENLQTDWRLVPSGNGFDRTRQRFQKPLTILMGIVALVLLLACANLANLLLARSAVRRREIAVRLAIGAGRGRIIRQLLAEGMLLALAGGLLGVALAYGFAERLVTMMSNGGARLQIAATPDGRVLLFALAASSCACILFSIAPAWHATRQRFQTALAEIRANRWRLGKGLIVAQMAISVLLLIGAGLFGRTLIKIYSVDPGFDRKNVVLFTTNAGALGYNTARVQDIQSRVTAELRSLPGVQIASLSKYPPVNRGSWRQSVIVDGRDPNGAPYMNSVAADFFKTYGTPVIAGREFNETDTATSQPVAIVNESFARHAIYHSSIGSWFAFLPEPNRHYQIVGVVKNMVYESLRDDIPPTAYLLAAQVPPGDSRTFAVRSAAGFAPSAVAIRNALVRVDPALRAQDVRTLEDHVARSLLQERMLATLAGFFGVLALLLSAVGIYGTMAYQVARRRREIGIRMALGAKAGSVIAMILQQTAVLTLAGCLIGAGGGLVLSRVVAGFLFGVQPRDPVAFGVAILALLTIAIAAAYLPGRRAARTNPVETLRVDA